MWLEKKPKFEKEIMSRIGIKNFEVLFGGLVNSVYKISFDGKNELVMKITNNQNEDWILKKERSIINNMGCVYYPNLIDFGTLEDLNVNFNIVSFFSGDCMNGINYEVSKNVFFDLGKVLAGIHQESDKKFGFLYDYNSIDSDPRVHNSYPGPYDNGFDQHYIPAKGWVEHLTEKGSRYTKQIIKIIEIMETQRSLFENGPCTYNHGDYQFKNILINKNNLEGIVDFDSYRVGDPSSDIHMFLQNCFDKRIRKENVIRFIDGYSSVKELPNNFYEKALFYRSFKCIQEVIAIPFSLRHAKLEEVKPYKEKISDLLDSVINKNDSCFDVRGEIYES